MEQVFRWKLCFSPLTPPKKLCLSESLPGGLFLCDVQDEAYRVFKNQTLELPCG